MQVMLGLCWGCRRRTVRSALTHSLMTTAPRTRMRWLGYGVNTLHQRGRQLYDRYRAYQSASFIVVPSFIKTSSSAVSVSFRLCPQQDRLLGLLMPFRAFGDVKFKWSIELQKRVLESGPDQLHENEHTKFIPPNYHTPPYLTAEPEITYHKLRPQDRFMVRREQILCVFCI